MSLHTSEGATVADTIRDKTKVLHRVTRIRGQLDAVEHALDPEEDCAAILMTIAACRGALNSLMAELFEGHIRFHLANPDHDPTSEKAKATQQLIDVVRTYLK